MWKPEPWTTAVSFLINGNNVFCGCVLGQDVLESLQKSCKGTRAVKELKRGALCYRATAKMCSNGWPSLARFMTSSVTGA